MPFSLAMIWHERGRYLPAVLAVAFSAVLVALQCGLLLGFLSVCSRPVATAAADLWVASPDVAALGYSHPVSEA
jgi:putative ABC transport system permease protein